MVNAPKIAHNDLVQIADDDEDRWYLVLDLHRYKPGVGFQQATVVEHDSDNEGVRQQLILTSEVTKRRRWVKGKR